MLYELAESPGGVGVGFSKNNWVGVCGPLLKTLTLFMTKICDFPYPIYDLTKKFDTLFMTLVHSFHKHKFVKGFMTKMAANWVKSIPYL